MPRYKLSERQWSRIASLLPDRNHRGRPGRPWEDHRPFIDGVLWVLHTGAPWRDLPECFGPWESVYRRFNQWRRDGTWVRLATSLLDELDGRGLIDHDLWCIDGTVIRASRAAAGAKKKTSAGQKMGGSATSQVIEPVGHALGRSRGGFGTKVHLVCDSAGWIVSIHVTPGQTHESKGFEPTMAHRLLPLHRGAPRWPLSMAGDKGYSYPRLRRWFAKRRLKAIIPTKSNQPRENDFDKRAYKKRNIVERVICWHKEYRSLGTRYEKLAVNYVALWVVAIIDRALKHMYSGPE
jgi:transposase